MKKLLTAMALFSAAAFADGVCTGPSSSGDAVNVYLNQTLTSTTVLPVDSSDSCSFDGYTFSNFQVAGGAGDNFTSSFDLTASFTTANGVEFSYSNLGNADIELYYTVTPGVGDMNLQVGTANSVTEVICATQFGTYADPNSTCGGTPLNQTTPFTVQSGGPTNENSLVTAASLDYVVKDITGGSEVFQQIVPEPMTLSLLGVGLLGLGLARRRAKK